MKNTLNSYIITSLTALAVVSGALYINYLSSTNEIDDSGQRQGYWVILGEMLNDPEYANSAIVEEGNFLNDMKTGVWKKYYPSGKLRSEITFDKNRPLGKYTLYYENGVIEEQGDWQRSKNVGEFIRNYENGKPHQRFYFADSGKRNGDQTYYHANGEVALEVNVLNGKENGVMKRYSESGELVEEKSFDGGTYVKGSTKDYREVKEEFVPEPVKVEEDSGIVETTKAPVKEEETNAAHHFQPNGHNVLYDKNKNITQTGIFKDGKLWNGKWHKYNNRGILLRVDIYRNGKFVGHGLLEEN